jgi:diamine N-acetyltransferase
MVELRRITHHNLIECLELDVSGEHYSYVDDNADSLAEAYASVTNGGFATPYAIYDGDVMVGFVMYTYFDKPDAYDLTDFGTTSPFRSLTPCYYIWRILVGKNHLRKGYAKQAIKKIIDEIRTFPHGNADCIYTSWNPENTGSKLLFESLGFVETGDISGDTDYYEVIVRLDI